MERSTQGSALPAMPFKTTLLASAGAMLFGFGVNVALEALGAFGEGRAPWLRSVLLFFTVYFALTLLYGLRAAKTFRATSAAGGIGGPLVVDTSALVDGRIVEVLKTAALDGPLLIAPFVLDELQMLADGSDVTRRTRGRRGLDVLNQLRTELGDRLQMHEPEKVAGFATAVDERLIRLAVARHARLLTVDVGLQKRAQAAGVPVVNWNELAVALKPPCLPGDKLTLQIVGPGRQATQGVGYLEDGTMVVVEGAREHVEHTVHLTVTSVTQTTAGRMVFGRFDSVV
ncbi:MAG: hypothetical protein C0483_08265 [Pirellula sp.]|nr:hypothetical protein [Pirellula sp.]